MKAANFSLLIVDDDEDDRFFLERAFQKLGAYSQIHAFANGNEAMAYINGKSEYQDRTQFPLPSYVITDLKMLPGDGFELLEFIRNHSVLSIIPVVVLSGSEDPEDIRHAYQLGANSFFTKPSCAEDLTALIDSIHDYWTQCQVPAIDDNGYAISDSTKGYHYLMPVNSQN